MNKTLLLILCDFLLLNLIHFTAWDKLDKESESAALRAAPKSWCYGRSNTDLELAAVRIKEREEDLKTKWRLSQPSQCPHLHPGGNGR